MRRPVKRRPSSRAAIFPPLVLELAAGIARQHKTTRRAVLLAAARVAVHQSPGAPTAYPTLRSGQGITVYLTPDLYELVLRTEADFFYGTLSWLCFYGVVLEGQQPLIRTLAMAEEELADLDRRALEALRGQPRCRIPTTARVPALSTRDSV